jgi:competence protein ComFC
MSTRLLNLGKGALEAWLGFFYPEVCQVCSQQQASAGEGYVCAECAAGVKAIEPPWCETCGRPYAGLMAGPFVCGICRGTRLHFTSARSAVAFNGFLKEVIHRYKYQQAMWFEPFLVQHLLAAAQSALAAGHWDYLVPVPLHRVKLREREFNQAERLAAGLSRATGIPLNAGLVERVQNTPSQTRLTRDERAANVRNAFAVKAGVTVTGARLVLVDDVMTTGATVNACARILRKAGAGDICVWTLARGL